MKPAFEPIGAHREHDDSLAAAAPPLVVDRQRIVHSAAFRRLQFKTQVFVSPQGDHDRTRLTHTLEVADLARQIAAALGANVDLAEVVSLAHDLGHPPFGHAGERALDACLSEHGGFEHNVHALRVVDYLEHPYPPFRGLNLTHVVRECLAKHTTKFDQPGAHPLQDGRPPPLEGQIAAIADRLAYGLHDLQDGLHAGMIDAAELAGVELWRQADDESGADRSPDDSRRRLHQTIDGIQASLVADVSAETLRRLDARGQNVTDYDRAKPGLVVELSAGMLQRFKALERLNVRGIYRNPALVAKDAEADRMLREVFAAFLSDPRRLPARYGQRVAEQGVQRVVADYVAGMTDRYCRREHARLCSG